MDNEIVLVVDGTSGSPELEVELATIFWEYFELWKVKQRKYGPGNIAAYGTHGVVIRLNDKVQRLTRFNFNGIKGDSEGYEDDAWLDALGYSVIGLMVYRGLWPKSPSHRVTLKQVISLMKQFIGGKFKWLNEGFQAK